MARMTVAQLASDVQELKDMIAQLAGAQVAPAEPAPAPAEPAEPRKFADNEFGKAVMSRNSRVPRKSEKRRNAIKVLRTTLGITTCEHGLKALLEMADAAGYDTSSL